MPFDLSSCFARPLWQILLLLALLGAFTACHKNAAPSKQTAGTAPDIAAPTEFLLDSQPFSPTLPYLFDQGRLVVLPPEVIDEPPPGTPLEGYAFSAVDRFGRLYHFDPIGRWYMDKGETLPASLPPEGWDIAWNPLTGALEALISVPWAGQANVQLLRLREGRWSRVALKDPPPTRPGACRVFQPSRNCWILAGGQGLIDGWVLRGGEWKKWEAVRPGGPDFTQIQIMMARQGSDALAVLTHPGDLWFWNGRAWSRAGQVRMENLTLASYDPHLDRILFVWSRGPGQDLYLWHPFKKSENEATLFPLPIGQTAMVRINEEEEGVWKDWGRVREAPGQTPTGVSGKQTVYQPGMSGTGEPAVRISAEYGDAIFRRSQIQCIEMPPRLDSLRAQSAIYVPALGGILAPSLAGLGIDAQHKAFFPMLANDDRPATPTGATSNTLQTIDVIQRFYRLWVFKEHNIDWIKPPYEIHPGIDYPNSYQTTNGQRRCLSWWFPEPGLLRYEFYEFQDQKVEWVHSPLLTLRTLPQLQLAPDEEIYVCDPAVWGDPAELIVIGWAGKLGGRRTLTKPPSGLSNEAYAEVPMRGFMARLSALTPDQWTFTSHDIPFNMGAQLIAAPGQNSLYLLGGKMAEEHAFEGQRSQFMVSNPAVWRWDGAAWQRLATDGIEPRMKVTSHITYDPVSRQLLGLTPRALYNFDAQSWHSLWQRQKRRNEQWPDDVGLYIHPLSHLILGAWFMPVPLMQVWHQDHWIPVRSINPPTAAATGATSATQQADEPLPPGGPLPDSSDNLLPSTTPDCFISVDATRLAAIRMDAKRERDQDRLLGAHWLTLLPANQGAPMFGRSALPPVPALQTPTAATDDATSAPSAGAADATTDTVAYDRPAGQDAPSTQPALIGAMRANEPSTASVVVPAAGAPAAAAPTTATATTPSTTTTAATPLVAPKITTAPSSVTVKTTTTIVLAPTTPTSPTLAKPTPPAPKPHDPASSPTTPARKLKKSDAGDDKNDDPPRPKHRVRRPRHSASDDDDDNSGDSVETKKSNAQKKVLNDD